MSILDDGGGDYGVEGSETAQATDATDPFAWARSKAGAKGQSHPAERRPSKHDAEDDSVSATEKGSNQTPTKRAEYEYALKAAFQTLNGAVTSAGRVGRRAAFAQVRLTTDGKLTIEERILDRTASEAWLMNQFGSGFEGFLSFVCLTDDEQDRDGVLIAKAIDTETRGRVQLRMPMRRMRMGRLKALKSSAEVECMDIVPK